MRIIAGRFKGRRIPSSKGLEVRPTTGRAREAVFSSLGPRVYGSRVLELFAGTGAFSLEALSRGAEHATLVERDRRTIEALAKTVQSFKVETSTSLLHMDALVAARRLQDSGSRFDIVFLDPPYRGDWIERLFAYPNFGNLVEPEGLVILEMPAAAGECDLPSGFERVFSRRYGRTLVDMIGPTGQSTGAGKSKGA